MWMPKKPHIKSWAFYWKGAVGLNQPAYAYKNKKQISERFVKKNIHICFILQYCEKKLYDIKQIDVQYAFYAFFVFVNFINCPWKTEILL